MKGEAAITKNKRPKPESTFSGKFQIPHIAKTTTKMHAKSTEKS